jgi:hypothetical protein
MATRFQRSQTGDPAGGDTMVDRLLDAPTPRILPPPLRRAARRGASRLTALLALGGFFVAGVAIVVTGLSRGEGKPAAAPRPVVRHRQPPPPPAPRKKPAPRKAVAAPIPIQAVAAFDPAGDGHENDSSVSLATDGNLATSWHTEHYRTWYKPGVGIVLDAGHPVRPTALTLETDGPGFVAEVQSGPSPTGPFTRISESSTTSDTTVYRLRAPTPERYVLLWITRIPDGGAADVNEVRLR